MRPSRILASVPSVALAISVLVAGCASSGPDGVDNALIRPPLFPSNPPLPPLPTPTVTPNPALPPGPYYDPYFFVAAAGDSYGSGEGNPAVAGTYGSEGRLDAGETAAQWGAAPWSQGSRECHRSDQSAIAKTMNRIKGTNGYLTMRFVNRSCSGAVSAHVTTNSYEGGAVPYEYVNTGTPLLPPQLLDLRTAYGTNKVDFVYISIGGNNSGFGQLIVDCFVPLFSPCDDEYSKLLGYLENGKAWERPSGGEYIVPGAREAIRQVATSARNKFPVATIIFSGYPDPVSIDPSSPRDANRDGLCSTVDKNAGGVTSEFPNDWMWNLKAADAAWIRDTFLASLNQRIAEGVASMNDPKIIFAQPNWGKSGFCTGPSQRAIMFSSEAMAKQGCDPDLDSCKLSRGGWHPTNRGYELTANAIEAAMRGSDWRLDTATWNRVMGTPQPPDRVWPTAVTSAGAFSIAWNDKANNESYYKVSYGSATSTSYQATVKLGADATNFSMSTSGTVKLRFGVQACHQRGYTSNATGLELCSPATTVIVGNDKPATAPGALTCSSVVYQVFGGSGCSGQILGPTGMTANAAWFSYGTLTTSGRLAGSGYLNSGLPTIVGWRGTVPLTYGSEPTGTTVSFTTTAAVCSIVDGGYCLWGPGGTASGIVAKGYVDPLPITYP